MTTNDEFAEYLRLHEERLPAVVRARVAATQLRSVELIALKVAFLCENAALTFAPDDEGAAARLLLLKFVHEVRAFVGCARDGSLVGAYHHARALLELRGAAHYIFSNPATKPPRVSRFIEWSRVVPYRYHVKREKELTKGRISQGTFDEATKRSAPRHAAVTAQQVAAWEALYGDKLAKVREWHHPKGIVDLIFDADTSGYAVRDYEIACHATHVSPIGYRLADADTLRLLGWDPEQGSTAVLSMAVNAVPCLDLLLRQTSGTPPGFFADETRAIDDALAAMGVAANRKP